MTTIEQSTPPAWDAVTVILPVSPTVGLDHLLRDIRADYTAVLAQLDQTLARFGIGAKPVSVPPRRRRWHW
jgi:hypothetical protein